MNPNIPSLEEFLNLPVEEVAKAVRAKSPKSIVFPFNGTRRWFLLEHGRSDHEFWAHYADGFARWHEDGGFACIAVVDGLDAGFIFCTEREGLFGYHSSPRIGYVEDIVVAPETRTAGIGRALMEAARSRFRERGYSHFELSSVPGNESARDFYRRLDLEPVKVMMCVLE